MRFRRRVVVAVLLSVAPWLVLTAATLWGGLPGGYMPRALFGVVGVVFYVFFERPARDHGLCLGCGYDLTGNVSGVCPECGTYSAVTQAAREEFGRRGRKWTPGPPGPPAVATRLRKRSAPSGVASKVWKGARACCLECFSPA
jgi:hypothetical protein